MAALAHRLSIEGHPTEIFRRQCQNPEASQKIPRHMESGQLALAGSRMEGTKHAPMMPAKPNKIKFLS